MTPNEVIESVQYHILQIESNFEDAYNMGLDLAIVKKSLSEKYSVWKYHKANFPEDFGNYNDGYLDSYHDVKEEDEENEENDEEGEGGDD